MGQSWPTFRRCSRFLSSETTRKAFFFRDKLIVYKSKGLTKSADSQWFYLQFFSCLRFCETRLSLLALKKQQGNWGFCEGWGQRPDGFKATRMVIFNNNTNPRKNVFDPRNPRKNNDPGKMLTHTKNISTNVAFVKIRPTQPTELQTHGTHVAT